MLNWSLLQNSVPWNPQTVGGAEHYWRSVSGWWWIRWTAGAAWWGHFNTWRRWRTAAKSDLQCGVQGQAVPGLLWARERCGQSFLPRFTLSSATSLAKWHWRGGESTWGTLASCPRVGTIWLNASFHQSLQEKGDHFLPVKLLILF